MRKITFATKVEAGSNYGQSDMSYAIDVDVQDASRRVISGSGSVKATRHDVAVFMDFPHGYATQGDRVDIEVETLILSPTSRFPWQERPEFIGSRLLRTRKRRCFMKSRSGRISRAGASSTGRTPPPATSGSRSRSGTRPEQSVSGSVYLWVGRSRVLARGRFEFRDIALLVENPYYEQDQTAKVLLIAPAPDLTVLLIREANNEILSKEVLTIAGRSRELKIPLTRKDVPNVHLTAISVHSGQVFQATQELFVPPTRQFASISVQADKQQYQPGERAHLRLTARDWRGQPLRSELSVAVTDAALNYIQKDYAPDIRSYYYGDRRSVSNPSETSFGLSIAPRTEDAQPLGQYAT